LGHETTASFASSSPLVDWSFKEQPVPRAESCIAYKEDAGVGSIVSPRDHPGLKGHSQTLTWDVENRLVGVTGSGVTMSAVYDGDDIRMKKTEGGQWWDRRQGFPF
jgi:hypothetical protein